MGTEIIELIPQVTFMPVHRNPRQAEQDGPIEQVRYARMIRHRTELAPTDLTYVMVSVDYAG